MNEDVSFRRREFKGSRLRCLIATSLANREVAGFLNALAQPFARVESEDVWQPRGFLQGDESRLGEDVQFLTAAQREELTAWWLAVRERANSPNWDIVSTCRTDDGRQGLVLVEAKAHEAELHIDGKSPGNALNDASIRSAIRTANEALGGAAAGWDLCAERHYQLCNRFAWAWKVASLGVPVVFVYLGFLDADEMSPGEFRTPDAWRSCILAHARGIVPESAWDVRLPVGPSWVAPVVRSARISAVVGEVSPV